MEKGRTDLDIASAERRQLARVEISSDYGWTNRKVAFGFDIEIIGSKDHLVSTATVHSDFKTLKRSDKNVSNAR